MARKVTMYYVPKDLNDAVDYMDSVGGTLKVQDGELRVFNYRHMARFEKEHPEYRHHPELHLKDCLSALRAWGMPDDCIVDEMKSWSNDGFTSVGAEYVTTMLKGI